MKRLYKLLFIGLLFTANNLSGQGISGYNLSNWAGVSGLDINPASIADMPYKFDMSLVGGGFTFSNNYVGVNWRKLSSDSKSKHVNDSEFQSAYLTTNNNSTPKSLFLQGYVQLPSFAVAISPSIAVGFTFKLRTMANLDDVSPDLATFAYSGLKNQTYWGVELNNDHLNLNEMTWGEYGFSYAQVFNRKGEHVFKVGGTVKLLEGLDAAYLYAQNLDYKWKNNDTLSLFNSNIGYGHSDNLGLSGNGSLQYKFITPYALGLDLGMVYEWRPNYKDYLYDLDGEHDLQRRDKTKYKLRLGFSVTDIGRIKFTKSDQSYDFNANITDWSLSGFKLGNPRITSLDDTIKSRFVNLNKTTTFYMTLPTAFSFQADYQLYHDFYVNFYSYTSPRLYGYQSKVYALSYYSLGARWDQKWFGVFVPLSYTSTNTLNLGTTLRLGPIIVGSSDILSDLFSNNVHGIDIEFAIKIPIFQGHPHDRDHDGVSDKKDHCPDVPGLPQFYGCPDTDGDGVPDDLDSCPTVPGPKENHGCPWGDKDGDGVPDNLDSCPTVPGPAANHGCPYGDRDHDGVPDNLDSCPDVAGPAANHGCPWGDKDHDGVPDNLDSCPTVPGPAANHGCPWGDKDGDGVPDNLDSCPTVPGPAANHGCPWGDADGDGVPDNLDSCPHTPGPAWNHGCPVIPKKEAEVVKTAFHDLEFEPGLAAIKASSEPSLDELAALLKSHTTYKLRLSGYTDNVGSDAANLALSKNRATAVKTALVNKGVDGSRIIVDYHGKASPIAPNTTPEGRAKNRRVEMKIIFD